MFKETLLLFLLPVSIFVLIHHGLAAMNFTEEHTGKYKVIMDKSIFVVDSYKRINRWEYRFEVDGVPITVDKDRVIIREIK